MARKKDIECARFALEKIDSLIAAAEDKEASCAIFTNPFIEDFTVEQKRSIRLYVESWIREPLAAALDAMEGSRDYDNERIIDSYTGKGWYLQ